MVGKLPSFARIDSETGSQLRKRNNAAQARYEQPGPRCDTHRPKHQDHFNADALNLHMRSALGDAADHFAMSPGGRVALNGARPSNPSKCAENQNDYPDGAC